ncbi:hypothetical protein BLNAU_10609 [Blattamonas nauphoetae]|uniref:Uncharacterized protein n=1 Tax=Blattamonas nauphoetae TaxID=2049346 RepID=A0ABQ9XPT8_9EUKA|nr:hypothetical protein BLNAU_10609 [Blattamonas nauphoetae]
MGSTHSSESFSSHNPETTKDFLDLCQRTQDSIPLNALSIRRDINFLESLIPSSPSSEVSFTILHDLVPTKNRNCEGFVNSIIKLFSSQNLQLLSVVLRFAERTISFASLSDTLDIIECGFFELLPRSFLQMDMHMPPNGHLLNILLHCTSLTQYQAVVSIRTNKAISTDTAKEILLERVFKPMTPFLNFICTKRSLLCNIYAIPPPTPFPFFFVSVAAEHEQTKDFIFSLPILACVTSLFALYESDYTHELIRGQLKGKDEDWRNSHSKKGVRCQEILRRLKEEGIEDEIEQQRNSARIHFMPGMARLHPRFQLILDFGENVEGEW